jgi:Flp pilus assembly protein TadD
MISKTTTAISLILIGTTVSAAAGWMVLHPRDKLANGAALAAKGDIRGAQIMMRGLIQEDPTRAEPHFQLGLLDLRLGDPVAAEKEFRAALDHGWPAPSVAVPMVEALLGQHRYADVLNATAASAAALAAPSQCWLPARRPSWG